MSAEPVRLSALRTEDSGRWVLSPPTPTSSLHTPATGISVRRRFSTDGRVRGSHQLLRYPLLLIVLLVILVELILYMLVRTWLTSYEFVWNFVRYRTLRSQLHRADSYAKWSSVARHLDAAEGRNVWKEDPKSSFYNYDALLETIDDLRSKRRLLDVDGLRASLLERVFHKHRTSVGIENEQLYAQTHFRTKYFISEFVDEILDATNVIATTTSLSSSQKIEFFEEALKNYGNTALCLSGGGTMGYFHLGVVKALLEARILPSILSGTSAGALIAALVGVRTDEELKDLLSPSFHKYLRPFHEGKLVFIKRLLTKGVIFDKDVFCSLTREVMFGDMTFEEAYLKTGRILNITVTAKHKHGAPIVLNYKTSPKIIVWSAVVASSSIPGLMEPVQLKSKTSTGEIIEYKGFGACWTDGSMKNDVPKKELSEMFNVTYFIVSQTNPHIVPFIHKRRGSAGEPSAHSFGSRLRGGFIASAFETFLKLELKKWLRLIRELDLFPEAGGYDWRFLFLQNFMGDVTIHLKMNYRTLWSYLKMASDPSYNDLKIYLEEGERLTWPKIAMIFNHYVFEIRLREALQSLRRLETLKTLEPSSL